VLGIQLEMMSDWWKGFRKFCILQIAWALVSQVELQEYGTENGNRSKHSPYPPPPYVPCASPPKGRQQVLCHNWALRGPLQVGRFPAQRSLWLVHTFVNFMRQRQSHCFWVRQLNDLLSKGYSTCAFLSTNQARAMPSDSSNNPNGNLVLNSLSDTTILLRQNSDRFGWQGRNACF